MKPTQKSFLALTLGAIAIGFAPIFVRASEVGPIATAFWRTTLALPFLLLGIKASSFAKKIPPPSPKGRNLLILAGIFFATDLAFWHWAIKFTLVANATLEANLSAVFVPLIAWLFFGQKVTPRFLVALTLTMGGTALLVGKMAHLSTHTLLGDALAIISALFYSGYLLTTKASRDRGFSTAEIIVTSSIITSLLSFPFALLSKETIWPHTLYGWTILLGLALVSQLIGQSLIIYALAKLPAHLASVALLIQPATAAIAAWVLFGEALLPLQILGGLTLLIGIWFARQNS